MQTISSAVSTVDWNWHIGSTAQVTLTQDLTISLVNIVVGIVGILSVTPNNFNLAITGATFIGSEYDAGAARVEIFVWSDASGGVWAAPISDNPSQVCYRDAGGRVWCYRPASTAAGDPYDDGRLIGAIKP